MGSTASITDYTAPCVYGKRCPNRATCPFAHFSSCSYGSRCTLRDCQYSHPPVCPNHKAQRRGCGYWHRPPLCKYGRSCRDAQCQRWHAPYCRFGLDCADRVNCKYMHPPNCPAGGGCERREGCTMAHPILPTAPPPLMSRTACLHGDNCYGKHKCPFVHPGGNLIKIGDASSFTKFFSGRVSYSSMDVYYIYNKTVFARYFEKLSKETSTCKSSCTNPSNLASNFLPPPNIERLGPHEALFCHGTPHINVHGIINIGLDVGKIQRGGALYFAEDPQVSNGYTDANPKGYHTMFIVRVNIGHGGTSTGIITKNDNASCAPLFLLYYK